MCVKSDLNLLCQITELSGIRQYINTEDRRVSKTCKTSEAAGHGSSNTQGTDYICYAAYS